MELKIKILEISPNIKTLKVRQTDILSLSFLAENIVIKIDNIEKSISNKDEILLILREYSPNEKIHFNLIRNDAIIIGTGKFTPTSGTKWYKIYDLVSFTENNINSSSKNPIHKKKNNINDSLINSNIKIKLEIQSNINKNKNKLNASNSKNINFSNSKNKTNLTGLANIDEKNNNSLLTSNTNSNFNKFKINQNINSYMATPAIKSPRFTNILTRTKSNNTNNNDSSKENTLKENNILPALDFEKEKNKKSSASRRTPSGKKFLYQTKKYKSLYGFNRSQVENKNYEKSVENNNILGNMKGKMSKEIEEKILDKNFQDIIKSDEILKGKEITDFNPQNSNNMDNEEKGKNLNKENNYINIENENNDKIQNIQNKNIQIEINNSKNDNNNVLIDKNILHEINNNESITPNNLKNDLNNMNQISAVSSAISSGRLMNLGVEIDLSADDLSGSFSAYDNIAKLLPPDEFKLTSDIEKENIEKYENVKNDFILFYNKEYINSINEEMLILELQLMIDKILEMQNAYKKQSIIIQRNFEKFRKKLIYFQKRNLILNKKMNKLKYEILKNKNHEEINDLYYNNKKLNFYREKNIFKSNELSLWNNLTLYSDDKNKKNAINYIKNKLNSIFLVICNKNINNLNTLSKKFFLEFVEKEKKKEKEKEKNQKIIKNKMNNTCSNFYGDNNRKNNSINNLKNKRISNKNSSNKYFKNNNRNDILENKSNKLLRSNETIKKDSKKEIFLIKESEANETNLLNSNKKIIKGKIKSNDFGGFNNRNNINKNTFNTMKSFSKKFINKK